MWPGCVQEMQEMAATSAASEEARQRLRIQLADHTERTQLAEARCKRAQDAATRCQESLNTSQAHSSTLSDRLLASEALAASVQAEVGPSCCTGYHTAVPRHALPVSDHTSNRCLPRRAVSTTISQVYCPVHSTV